MADVYCKKCGRTLQDKEFYKKKNGEPLDICKKCFTMHINVFKPETFMWALEKIDIPYIEEEFNATVNKDYAKKGSEKFNHAAAFGKYLSKMKLGQWNKYTFADTERLKAEKEERLANLAKQEEEYSNDLLKQLQEGQISEYEYKTMTSVVQQEADRDKFLVDPNVFAGNDKKSAKASSASGELNFYDEEDFIPEDELPDPASELTQEDKVYLAMKWGRLYKPAEWIELEATYKEYVNSFEVNDPDTEKALMMICKVILKMNQALDAGDVESFKKLSSTYESMRKSTKFTAAQNKEDKDAGIASIGELIVMCEQDGFIPQFPTDIPQDKVDFTIKDMNNYAYKLVTQDLGFGDQIENALKALKLRKEEEEEANLEEDKEIEGLGDKDISEYLEEIENQRLVDAERNDYEEDEEEYDEDDMVTIGHTGELYDSSQRAMGLVEEPILVDTVKLGNGKRWVRKPDGSLVVEDEGEVKENKPYGFI